MIYVVKFLFGGLAKQHITSMNLCFRIFHFLKHGQKWAKGGKLNVEAVDFLYKFSNFMRKVV